jgi:hypothetical protein
MERHRDFDIASLISSDFDDEEDILSSSVDSLLHSLSDSDSDVDFDCVITPSCLSS